MLLALPTPSLFFIACGKCCLHCLRLFKPPSCFLLDCSGSIIASCFKSWAWVTCMCDCTAFVWKGEKGGGGEAQFCILALLPIVAVSLQAASILDSGLHAYVIVLPLSGGGRGRGGGRSIPLHGCPGAYMDSLPCMPQGCQTHCAQTVMCCTEPSLMHWIPDPHREAQHTSPLHILSTYLPKDRVSSFVFFDLRCRLPNHCAEENVHVC